MSSDYDATEFIDGDFQAHHLSGRPGAGSSLQSLRTPTREEVDCKVAEAQQKLGELKRAQEELERERAALEETRRRHTEFQTGRQEMVQHLTRGVGLLEEAEFAARRDAEQMSKTLTDLKTALGKVEAIHEESWGRENFGTELTRALTTVENARMEWNGARLKFPLLSTQPQADAQPVAKGEETKPAVLGNYHFGELCRLGFALTWPLAAVVLLGFLGVALLLRH